ncbi:hypothetical protein F5X99DRAFT_370227 [Biscogniauxia marginata]|nr:hypothetical protein F5X99DRAFT_370227 [Biscogniauxia marginata]
MFPFWPFSREARPSPNYDPTHEDDADQDVSGPQTRRVVLGAHSTRVYGYPSSGGVLVLPFCNGVDLAFLHLPRLGPAERSGDPAAEDRHCARMRRLGAWWFASVDEYESTQYFSPERLDRKMLVVAAWPRGGAGVWVVTMRVGEASEKGLACVWNALSMDERCEAVEKLGGRFYPDPVQCPDLKL